MSIYRGLAHMTVSDFERRSAYTRLFGRGPDHRR